VTASTKTDLVLVRLSAARIALKDAKTIQDTKRIVDLAAAAEIYAKRQQLSQESIDYAHDIKIEALAQLGRMRREAPKATGGEHGGRSKIDGTRRGPSNPTPTNRDLGLDKKTSADDVNSTLAKPLLNFAAAAILSSSAWGIASPVR